MSTMHCAMSLALGTPYWTGGRPLTLAGTAPTLIRGVGLGKLHAETWIVHS